MSELVKVAVVDVDGTLVDSNYQHAVAWFRAFRQCDVTVPVWRIHRAIGMGGDRLVAAVAGDEVERRHGDTLRAAWADLFDPVLGEITALAGARELLHALRDNDFTVVLASSGKPEHVHHYLDLLAARSLVDGWTTADDVEETKPAPDLIEVALDKAPRDDVRALAIGDSVWDCHAAGRIGVPTAAVRTGGFGVDELTEADAVTVLDDLPALIACLPDLPTAAPRR